MIVIIFRSLWLLFLRFLIVNCHKGSKFKLWHQSWHVLYITTLSFCLSLFHGPAGVFSKRCCLCHYLLVVYVSSSDRLCYVSNRASTSCRVQSLKQVQLCFLHYIYMDKACVALFTVICNWNLCLHNYSSSWVFTSLSPVSRERNCHACDILPRAFSRVLLSSSSRGSFTAHPLPQWTFKLSTRCKRLRATVRSGWGWWCPNWTLASGSLAPPSSTAALSPSFRCLSRQSDNFYVCTMYINICEKEYQPFKMYIMYPVCEPNQTKHQNWSKMLKFLLSNWKGALAALSLGRRAFRFILTSYTLVTLTIDIQVHQNLDGQRSAQSGKHQVPSVYSFLVQTLLYRNWNFLFRGIILITNHPGPTSRCLEKTASWLILTSSTLVTLTYRSSGSMKFVTTWISIGYHAE